MIKPAACNKGGRSVKSKNRLTLRARAGVFAGGARIRLDPVTSKIARNIILQRR